MASLTPLQPLTTISTSSQELSGFAQASIINRGAGSATITGSAAGSVAITILAGEAFSFPFSQIGYQSITVDGTGTTLHIVQWIYS